MLQLLFVILFIAQFSFSLIQEEVRGLCTKPHIITIDLLPHSLEPKLQHAVQNNVVISLLTTKSTEYTRATDITEKHTSYSARFLENNTYWDPRIAEKSFYELIIKYRLVDKKPEEILKSCTFSTTIMK